MVDLLSHESMTHVDNLITGHEFDRGMRLVVHNDTPCHFLVPGQRGANCGWYPRDHASELTPEQIQAEWPAESRGYKICACRGCKNAATDSEFSPYMGDYCNECTSMRCDVSFHGRYEDIYD